MINKINLPYPMDALEPYYSKETLLLHYDILYSGYVNNTNKTEEKLKQARETNNFENINREESLEKVKKIEEDWKKYYYLLAYFIEHDELEKIETSLIGIESYIEAEEYGEGIAKIDESVFILQHIEKKYRVSLQNVF